MVRNCSCAAGFPIIASVVVKLVPRDMYVCTENMLTHWGRVTQTWVCELNTIGSDNGLSPGRRQAIIWTKAGILLTGPLGTKFNEILNRNLYIFF